MYYAKSNPVETIKQHTDKLLENLGILRKLYGNKITENINIEENRFWQLMQIICKYHDCGKVFTAFQNEIRVSINQDLIPTRFKYDLIKHEQLSPMFVPCKKYELTKEERRLVYQAIYYHHERNSLNIDIDLLSQIIEEDIKPNLEKIKKELQIEVEELKVFYTKFVGEQNRINEGDNLYIEYCLMKGLLHRLDYCSSAGIKVEDETNDSMQKYVENYIYNNKFNINLLQEYSRKNQNNNLIIIGSTGIGKTEASLLWSKNDKTFFTLPLRISINAIYDRILEKIKYDHIGILHSTALDYIEEKSEFTNQLEKINKSKNLYEKITACTIDQIFTFVFKYKGYERIYATLKYSKIIIDEIQAYSPEIVAVILKGIQMINEIGGKFMIMTATLPRIYKEQLEKMKVNFLFNEFIKDTKRHKIKLENKLINDDIQEIINNSKNNKILIIVNTINKAIELYSKLKEFGKANINLLHSRFILEDRNDKERKIKEFSNNNKENGIWITTQIVEASLDIDFDYLYTEMSTLDSLFQRLGRCYRNREYTKDECNVKIYVKDVSGVKYVYDEDINKKSIELLEKYDGKVLDEKTKVDLVDKLYSKDMICNTDFYRKFENGMKVLDNIIDYNTSKLEAQKLLRNIENINVIPKSIYDINLYRFEEYEKEKDYNKKSKIKRNIMKLVTSISMSNKRKFENNIIRSPYIDDIFIIDAKYDNEVGLLLERDEEYEIDKRIF